MITWNFVRDGLAVVGGILSLLLTLWRFLDGRPVVVLEWVAGKHSGAASYRLRIRNTSRYPIHIGAVRIWLPRKKDAAFDRIWSDDWELRDYLASAMARRLDIYLAEGKEVYITFDLGKPEVPHLMLAVYWYRHQPVILPTVPKLLYRSRRELEQLRAHAIKVKE
jgi:hypothetical protein